MPVIIITHLYDSGIGILLWADSVVYIGEKVNNINEQVLDVKMAQEFIDKQEIMDEVLSISQKQAEVGGF